MTGKKLLLHPFINCDQIAPYMYPGTKNPAALLQDKLQEKNGETFNEEDDEKAFAAFGLLLRGMMQWQGNKATFDPDAFFDN